MDSPEMVKVFRALACKKRFAIVKLLLTKESCAGSISKALGASQSSISQHLRVLRDLGIVTDNRDGNHIHYTANKDLLKQINDSLSEMLSTKIDTTECPTKGKLCAENVTVETQQIS